MLKNHNSLLAYLWSNFPLIIFHTILCPLYNLKTVRDISMKLGTLIKQNDRIVMHKNYNTWLHILDMHVESGGGHQFSRRKQILVCFVPINLLFWAGYSILTHYIVT